MATGKQAAGRWGRWACVLAVSAVCAAQTVRPPMPPQLTLAEAVRLALAHSPVLRLAAAAVAAAEGDAAAARAELLPKFGVRAAQGVETRNLAAIGLDSSVLEGPGGRPVPDRIGPYGGFDLRAAVSQQIFNLSQTYAYRADKRRAEASIADRHSARQALVSRVIAFYVEALRAQAGAATLRKQLALARELHTLTVDRVAQGVASLLDQRRSQQQLNYVQQLLLEAETGLHAAKLQLAAAIHARVSADYELADIARFYDKTTLSEQEALAMAFQARQDYRAAEARLAAAALDRKRAGSARAPRLSFYADYGQSGNRPFDNLNTYTVRGELTAPIYFGGRGSAEQARAQAGVAAAEARLEQLRAEIEAETLIAHAAVASAQRQVQLAEQSIGLGEEEVDLTTARFVEGVADNTEILAAQQRLARAEENRIRALYNFNLARAQLHRALGSAEDFYGK